MNQQMMFLPNKLEPIYNENIPCATDVPLFEET